MSLFVALLTATSADAASTASERNAPKEIIDVVTSDSLTLEIALTRKLIADESFLTLGGCTAQALQVSLTAPRQAGARLEQQDTGGCQPWDEYQYARQVLEHELALSRLNPAQQKTHALLLADIDYRQLLLSHRLGFWGGVRSLSPTIPIRHLAQMKSLLQEFETLASEIESSTARVEDLELEASKIRAVSAQASGQLESSRISGETQDILRRNEATRQQAFSQRAEALEAYRAALERKAQALRDENKSIEAGVTRAVVNAVAASAGVPLETVDAAKSGDLRRAALGYASTDAGNELLQSTLSQVSVGSQTLIDTYSQVRETVATVEEAKRSADQIKRFVRNPSADALVKLGGDLANSPFVSEEQRTALIGAVRAAKPVLAATQMLETVRAGQSSTETCRQLFENEAIAATLGVNGLPACGVLTVTSAQVCNKQLQPEQRFGGLDVTTPELAGLVRHIDTACEVHGAITTVLADEPRWRELLSAQIRASLEPFAQQGVAFLGRSIERARSLALSDQERLAIVQIAMAEGGVVAYRAFLQAFDPALRPQIDRALRSYLKNQNVSEETLVKLLAPENSARLRALTIRHGELTIKDAEGRTVAQLDTPTLLKAVGEALAAHPAAIELARLRADVDYLLAAGEQFSAAVLRELPAASIEEAVKQITQGGKRQQAQLWDRMMRSLPQDSQARVQQRAAALLLGAQAADVQLPPGSVPEPVPETPVTSASTPAPAATSFTPPPTAPAASGPSTEEALATAALTAAFPAAGVALKVLQGVAMSAANEREIARMENEQLRIVAEMVELQELERTAQLQEAIAKQEIRVAEALIAAAREQTANYQFAVRQASQSSDRQRVRIALRRPLVFYLAERLRQEFFSLDRGLYLWAGNNGSPGKEIEQRIKNDPQNVRLALDSEIHLFDWLNRDRESTRSDVDGLLLHWRQLVRLAEDLCHSEGCQPGDGLLGQVQQSPVYRLSQLVDEQSWAALRAWQRAPDREAFTLSFLVHPGLAGFPPAYAGLRLIDVRLAAIDSQGRAALTSGASLRHPGVAIVPMKDDDGSNIRFAREMLLPRQSSSFDPPDPFSLEDLRTRWSNGNDATPRLFEGYGMFTSWELSLQPDQLSRSLEDIAIRFAYSYANPDQVVNERSFIQKFPALQVRDNLHVAISEWRVCKGKADASDCQPLLRGELPTLLAQALMLTAPAGSTVVNAVRSGVIETSFFLREVPKSCASILEQLHRNEVALILTGSGTGPDPAVAKKLTRADIMNTEETAQANSSGKLLAINEARAAMNADACALP